MFPGGWSCPGLAPMPLPHAQHFENFLERVRAHLTLGCGPESRDGPESLDSVALTHPVLGGGCIISPRCLSMLLTHSKNARGPVCSDASLTHWSALGGHLQQALPTPPLWFLWLKYLRSSCVAGPSVGI